MQSIDSCGKNVIGDIILDGVVGFPRPAFKTMSRRRSIRRTASSCPKLGTGKPAGLTSGVTERSRRSLPRSRPVSTQR